MNRQIIRRKPIARTARMGVLGDRVPVMPFRGVIGAGFNEWLYSHWGVGLKTQFSPARKLFRKTGALSELPAFPPANIENVSNHTLLSVNLSMPLAVSSRTFTGERERLGPDRVRGFGVSHPGRSASLLLLRQLSPVLLKLVRGIRDRVRPGRSAADLIAGLLLIRENSMQRDSTERRSVVRLGLQPIFAMLGRSTRAAAAGVEPHTSHFLSRLTKVYRTGGLPGLVLRDVVNAFFKTEVSGDRRSHLELSINQPKIHLSLAAASSSSPSLKLALPGLIANQTNTEVRARFAEASTMYYARRESQLVERLVSALKELQISQPQPRAVSPPQIEIEQLTRQVSQHLERELRIEKERRGL